MARIAQGVSEAEVDRAANWHLSLENVQAANDRIIGVSANLELPEIYRREPERLHTASDGQKFAVRRASLNANHSFKYFGKGQGISAYTFRELLEIVSGRRHDVVVVSLPSRSATAPCPPSSPLSIPASPCSRSSAIRSRASIG